MYFKSTSERQKVHTHNRLDQNLSAAFHYT